MSFVPVAQVGQLPPGAVRRISVAGRTIAVFNLGGTFYALDDRCSHEGGFLSLGGVEGTRVHCPVHGAVFDLCTGRALEPPVGETALPPDVRTYRTRVLGTEVEVDIDEDDATRGIQTVLEL